MFSSELAGGAIKFVGKELLLRGSSLENFFLFIIGLAGLLTKARHVSLPTSAASHVLSCSHPTEVLCSATTANLASEGAEHWDISIVICCLVNIWSSPLLLLIPEYESVLIALGIYDIIIGDRSNLNFWEWYGPHVFCRAFIPSSMIRTCTLLDVHDAPLSEGTLRLIIIRALESHTWHTEHRRDTVLWVIIPLQRPETVLEVTGKANRAIVVVIGENRQAAITAGGRIIK